jgi:hypothetical protein
MTLARLISPALRSGLMISVGTLLMVLPFVTGMDPDVVVTGIFVGGLQVTLGIAGTDNQGRGTIPVSAQAVYDRGIALGLLAVGVLYGILGDQMALLLFGLSGLAVLLVTITTRYSVRTI